MPAIRAGPLTGAARERYEFGPLLIGKPRRELGDGDGAEAPVPPTAGEVQALANAEQFRVSNNGLFPAHIDFAFKDGEGVAPSPFA